MARVKSEDTEPELIARSIIHRMGYRFRLHRDDLPGSPDIVLPRHRKVVFVHGCFWHSHDCPKGSRPGTRTDFWNEKLDRNVRRDTQAERALRDKGWDVLVIWECELSDIDLARKKLRRFLEAS